MILIWYCFYNLNETAVCALDIFLVVGELWTKNHKGAKKNIQHTQSLVLFSLSMTQFVILTKIDVDRNSGGKGKPQREGCYQLYWRASLLVIQKLWVIQEFCNREMLKKKGWRDGNLYRMKTRTKWFDILYTQNQLVLLAYFTDCSSLGIQFVPFPLFFWIANRCYFSSYLVRVSFFILKISDLIWTKLTVR